MRIKIKYRMMEQRKEDAGDEGRLAKCDDKA